MASDELLAYAKGWVDMVGDLDCLIDLASHANSIVEFGVRGAVSTWALLDGLPSDGTLLSIDISSAECSIPPRVTTDQRFTFVVGNDLEVELPAHADLVMVDSSHLYEQTVEELKVAAAMTPDVIALHDYYLDWGGVRQAIEEFKGPYHLDFVNPSRYGLAVLRK